MNHPTKPYDKYAWPGGYPIYALMHDGESMCIDCANKEDLASFDTDPKENHGWQIVALDINYEDPNMICCHCNKRIESAYAEDEAK
jgi:hypothetical protein